MPITTSAKKALRQNKKRRAHNVEYKRKIKSLMKTALFLCKQRKQKELEQLIPSLYQALDKAAKVGVLKKNTAARRKSHISKKLAGLVLTLQK